MSFVLKANGLVASFTAKPLKCPRRVDASKSLWHFCAQRCLSPVPFSSMPERELGIVGKREWLKPRTPELLSALVYFIFEGFWLLGRLVSGFVDSFVFVIGGADVELDSNVRWRVAWRVLVDFGRESGREWTNPGRKCGRVRALRRKIRKRILSSFVSAVKTGQSNAQLEWKKLEFTKC